MQQSNANFIGNSKLRVMKIENLLFDFNLNVKEFSRYKTKYDFLNYFVYSSNFWLKFKNLRAAGTVSYSVLGNLYKNKIVAGLKKKLFGLNYSEVDWSALQHAQTFSSRDKSTIIFSSDKKMVLAPTYEEIFHRLLFDKLAAKSVKIFQISKKFRKDRPQGLFRFKEFYMMDAYCAFTSADNFGVFPI